MARPTRTNPLAAAAGAGVGAFAGPLGAALGGLFGAAIGTDPLPLDEALRDALRQRDLQLVKAGFETPHSYRVLFARGPGRYWTLRVRVDRSPNEAQTALLDRVYDRVLDAVEEWRKQYA